MLKIGALEYAKSRNGSLRDCSTDWCLRRKVAMIFASQRYVINQKKLLSVCQDHSYKRG